MALNGQHNIRMIRALISFCILPFFLYSDIDPVQAYVHHSELQRSSAITFITPHLEELSGTESILDIGCGDGRIASELSKFVPDGFVIGIDPSVPMLTWAKKQYPPSEYPNLFFQEGEFLKPNLTKSFDLIISTFALQHCKDQVTAFRVLKKLLRPGGKLLLLLLAFDNDAWNEASKTVRASSKWASYFRGFVQKRPLKIEEYEELLRLAHLHPSKVAKKQTLDPFIDRQAFLQFLLGSFTPPLLQEKAIEFHNDFIDEYLRRLPSALQSNGVIEARLGRIEIEAQHLPEAFFSLRKKN